MDVDGEVYKSTEHRGTKNENNVLVKSVAHKRGGVLLCLACNLIWVIYLSGTDFLTYHCSLALIIQDSSQHIILPRLFDTILQNCDIVTKDDKGRQEKAFVKTLTFSPLEYDSD